MTIELFNLENAGQVNHARSYRRVWYALNNGIAGVADAAALDVTGSGTNLSVNVASGQGFIAGANAAQGHWPFYVDGVENVVLEAANVTNPRIDLIVARAYDNEYGDADPPRMILEPVTGIAGATPATPAQPARSLLLARVDVPANSTICATGSPTGTQSYVTEKRVRCGSSRAARGEVGTSDLTQTGPGIVDSRVAVNGSGVTFTTVAQRKYRYTLSIELLGTVAFDVARINLMRDGSDLVSPSKSLVGGSWGADGEHATLFVDDVPSAGSHTYHAEIRRYRGTGSLTVEASGCAVLDDLGGIAALT